MQLWRCIELAGEVTALAVFSLKRPSITRIGPLQTPLSKITLSWSICNENYKFAKSTEVENRWVEGTAFCRRTPSLQLNEDATCRVCYVQIDMCMYFVNANEAKVTGQLRRHADQLNQPSPLYLIRSQQRGAPHHATTCQASHRTF